MDEPGDSSAYAACTTAGTPGDQSVLYYSCPNPTQYDTAAWVTDSFGVDTTISSGTWRFILWARVDTFHYDPPFDWLLHYIGVKVYRYRGGIPETLLFEAFKGGPGAWLNTDWGADTIDVDTSSVSFLAGDRLWAEVWTERDASVDDPVQVEFAYNNRPGQHDSRFRPGVIVGVSERENQEKSHPPFFVEPLRGGFRAHTYSFTQCSVFDVAGRLVRRSAVRSGIAQFRNLPSGIYFLVLEAGKDRAYHKVLVLR